MSGQSGDEWVEDGQGNKHWGKFGAAGVLAFDAATGSVLLQHRASFSHHGDTWGIPGGARHRDETAVEGAFRESQEEAGIPDGALTAQYSFVLDLGAWSYTTVIADVVAAFEPEVTDSESQDVAWIPVDQVAKRDLHPAFAAAWPVLAPLLGRKPVLVVDVANVMGSTPDGWWKDRRGAATRMRDNIERFAETSPAVSASLYHDFDVPSSEGAPRPSEAFPKWLLVVEGQAKGVKSSGRVQVVDAPRDGDGAIVDHVARLAGERALVSVFTSDVLLKKRVLEAGAVAVNGSKNLVTMLKQAN